MTSSNCLFCDKDDPKKNVLIDENELTYARWDNFPFTDGHAEVVPKRHVESFFDLEDEEMAAIYSLAKNAQSIIQARYSPDAFNIGVNDGEAAGRTIHHLHIHIIPRYQDDAAESRGGVRYMVPKKEGSSRPDA